MKTKVKIKDFNGKITEKEITSSGKDHLTAQIKYKSKIFKDKTKYNRKVKHKNKTFDE